MYKLLIVDDEPLVQVGIKSMLPWEKMQIEITGIASNGKAACQMIENDMPDIVITDIKMPIMSGLELVKYCNEKFEHHPEFIILTSYEDFSLARKAITYHVQDYLVKLELTPDLLRSSVDRIISELEAKHQPETNADNDFSISYYQERFYLQLLNNMFENREQFILQSKELNISFEDSGYLTCYCEIRAGSADQISDENQINLYHSSFQMTKELISQYHKCHVIALDLYHLAIVFCFDSKPDIADIADSLQGIMQSLNGTLYKYYMSYLICGFGTFVSDPLAISESYQYSRDAFSSADEDDRIVFFNNCAPSRAKNSFNFTLFKDILNSAFEEYDTDTLCQTIDEMMELFKANPHHYLQAIDFASNILYLAISHLPNGESTVAAMFGESYDNYLSLYKMKTMEQVLDWLSYFKAALCEYFTTRKKEVRKPIVTQAKKYIKNHINSRLSLQEVAAALCISPNYLSQLFKKYNKIGFTDYVTQCKVDEAKHYLYEGNLCIYEIAEKLGFESAFYFSKVFKKVEGISPSDYQKR